MGFEPMQAKNPNDLANRHLKPDSVISPKKKKKNKHKNAKCFTTLTHKML
jgi:hypothetical protein